MQFNDGVFKENFYGEIICHLKVKGLIHIVVNSGLKENLRISISPPVILLRGVPLNIVIGHEVLCIIKGTN